MAPRIVSRSSCTSSKASAPWSARNSGSSCRENWTHRSAVARELVGDVPLLDFDEPGRLQERSMVPA